MKIQAIIIARGDSKGIHKKNIVNFFGKPLIYWTINQIKTSRICKDIWVSSDNDEILNISKKFGAKIIKRPKKFAKDKSSSEEAWLHAINYIENQKKLKIDDNDILITPQVTSPLRKPIDFCNALKEFKEKNLDSLFTGDIINDYFIWEKKNNILLSTNYNYKKRLVRQKIFPKIHENGSFYIFKKKILTKYKNRLGGKIGSYLMPKNQSFQIDDNEDLIICKTLFKILYKYK